MDLDLRKLRYFLALAEERHFGRAAERLLIAQPVLSRQIRALEHELGCQLLTRSTRSVELTAAGRQLQADGPGVLTAADLATSRTLERARGVQRLVVGFAPGLTVSTLVRAYGREHPDVDVQMLYVNGYEQAEAVIDGRVDVGYLRGDFSEEPRLRTVTVGEEARVACMPENHPLARRRSLKLSDLDGEMMLHAEARRAATIENKFEGVAAGRGIVEVPRSVARAYARAGLVHRRITDAPVESLCVAIAAARRAPHVEAFYEMAVDALSERAAAPARLRAVS
jgi:DNA-binding transcriptional LysR family regulator